MDEAYFYTDEAAISNDLICSVCQSPFQAPCCAPCGDTFCRECITSWIQSGNSSCPLCRSMLTMAGLTEVPRALRNILDQLAVTCVACKRRDIKRGNIDEHKAKICPKTIVACLAADINCAWAGPRDQLDRHLTSCRLEPVRPIIRELMDRNQELEQQEHQYVAQIFQQHHEVEQLRYESRQQADEIQRYENRCEEQQEQMKQLNTSVDKYKREKQELERQLRERNDETQSLRRQLESEQSIGAACLRIFCCRNIDNFSSCCDCMKNARARAFLMILFSILCVACVIFATIFGVRHDSSADIILSILLALSAILFLFLAILTRLR